MNGLLHPYLSSCLSFYIPYHIIDTSFGIIPIVHDFVRCDEVIFANILCLVFTKSCTSGYLRDSDI